MKQAKALLPATLLSLALIACNRDDPNNFAIDEANNAASMSNVETLPPSDSAAVTETPSVTAPDGPPVTTIPAAFTGRWGMVPGDCTSTRGDNKGLMTISPDRIKFYESEARPATLTLVGERRIDGNYSATGEGQSWTLLQRLELGADGTTLVRTVDEGDSAPTPGGNRFAYRRCA